MKSSSPPRDVPHRLVQSPSQQPLIPFPPNPNPNPKPNPPSTPSGPSPHPLYQPLSPHPNRSLFSKLNLRATTVVPCFFPRPPWIQTRTQISAWAEWIPIWWWIKRRNISPVVPAGDRFVVPVRLWMMGEGVGLRRRERGRARGFDGLVGLGGMSSGFHQFPLSVTMTSCL